jgi:hypothetical protein
VECAIRAVTALNRKVSRESGLGSFAKHANRPELVFRRPFYMVNDEHISERLPRREFEPKLFLQGNVQRR